jgi:hypothetical protein
MILASGDFIFKIDEGKSCDFSIRLQDGIRYSLDETYSLTNKALFR